MKTSLLFSIVLLASCSHQKTVWLDSEKLQGPRVLSIDSPNVGSPWLTEIELKLKQSGITVKRSASKGLRTDKTKTSDLQYNESASRYVLLVKGNENTSMRCFGGGYSFDNINAELYDSKENKSILSVSDSGYSEGCAPAYSDMFENISRQIASAFEK